MVNWFDLIFHQNFIGGGVEKMRPQGKYRNDVIEAVAKQKHSLDLRKYLGCSVEPTGHLGLWEVDISESDLLHWMTIDISLPHTSTEDSS